MLHPHHGIIFAIFTKHMFFFDAIFLFLQEIPDTAEFRLRLEYQGLHTPEHIFPFCQNVDHPASAHACNDYRIRLTILQSLDTIT